MAIALRGTPTTGSPNTAASFALTLPSGIVSGDIIYVFGVVGNGGTTLTCTGGTNGAKTFVAVGNTGSTPDGWTGALVRRVSDGTEGASLTFAPDVGADFLNVECRAYSGANTTTPEDPAGNSTNHGNTGTTANVTGITTSNAGNMNVFFCFDPDATVTFTAPSGYGNGIQDSNNGETVAGFDKSGTTSGAVSAGGVTSGNNWGAFLFAIQPPVVAAAGAPPKLPIAAITGNQPWQAAPPHIHHQNVVFRAANLPDKYNQAMPPVPAIQAGMMSWWAPVPSLKQHNVVFQGPNQPDPYRHSMAPIPAVQAGMQQWWAPVVQMRTTNIDFRGPNLPDPYRHSMPPIPAVQAGMQGWWAPVPALHTNQQSEGTAPPTGDTPAAQLPIQAIQQQWWAPVPALQNITVPFSPPNQPDPYRHSMPPVPAIQAGMAGWWAPVPALHPTITEFHGATELDARPSQLPLQAIQQAWWAPVVHFRQYNVVFRAPVGPDFTTYRIPSPAIQGSWWAPIFAARTSPAVPSGPAPSISGDPIVVWRHRAGMQ